MEWGLTKLAQKDCFAKTYMNLIRKHCEYLTSLNERCNLYSCFNVNSSFFCSIPPGARWRWSSGRVSGFGGGPILTGGIGKAHLLPIILVKLLRLWMTENCCLGRKVCNTLEIQDTLPGARHILLITKSIADTTIVLLVYRKNVDCAMQLYTDTHSYL